MRRGAIIALLSIWPVGALAQAPGPAAPLADSAEISRYRFDLARNFFPTPEAEVAGRAELEREIEALATLSGRIASAPDLLAALEADDRASRRFRRHDLYLFLRYAVDIREEAGMRDAEALRVRLRAARQALRRAIAEKEAAWLDTAIGANAALARYRHFIDTVRREAAHLPGPERQAAITALEPLLGARDYPRIVNGLSFGDVRVGDRTLNAGRDQAELDASPSEAVRREGSRLLFEGYASQRQLFAQMLIRVVEGGNALAGLRGHASAAAEAAFNAYVAPGDYERLLAEVARHGDAYKAWQRRTGDPFAITARWRPSEGAALISASAAALDARYGQEFAALLDPPNGRADLAGGEHRLPITGTASVYPTGQSAIYMRGYQGTLLDLIVLAHEGGHAVQAQLMARDNVPMVHAAGPGYFTESFGRFQELLLLDHLLRHERSAPRRAELRDAFAARLLSVFPSAEEAAVELAIHKGVGEGRIRTPDDLDSAAAAAGAPYSIDYERTPERRGVWMLADGYFMAPMQELNDAYASLLAIRYFQLYRRDPARFRRGYLALLSGGYDAAPADLLRRHLDIDMNAPGFVAETMTALRADIDALYR